MKNIENVVDVLWQHITEIATVTEWANKMEYSSTDYFSRKFRNHYGIRPKEVLIKKRLDKIRACLRESPDDIYYSIARKMGFVDSTSLYKFVNWHTGKSITDLKMESENGV